MQNFLTGRQQQPKQSFFSRNKREKGNREPSHDAPEVIELAASEVDSDAAPRVEMIMELGVVQRIVITMPNGQIVELACEYEEN